MGTDIAKTSCPFFSSAEATSLRAREQAGDGETTPDEVCSDSASRKTIRLIYLPTIIPKYTNPKFRTKFDIAPWKRDALQHNKS